MDLLIFFIIIFGLQPTPAFAQTITITEIPYSTTTAQAIVRLYAAQYEVSGDEMWKTTLCENASLDPKKQSEIIQKNGKREDSWGNSQINLYWHPEVTREQAQNPYFSAEFMAKEFAKGNQWKWSCWKKHFGNKKTV